MIYGQERNVTPIIGAYGDNVLFELPGSSRSIMPADTARYIARQLLAAADMADPPRAKSDPPKEP